MGISDCRPEVACSGWVASLPDAMRASQVDGTSNLVLLDKPQRLALPQANVSYTVEASAVVSSPGRARARQCPL